VEYNTVGLDQKTCGEEEPLYLASFSCLRMQAGSMVITARVSFSWSLIALKYFNLCNVRMCSVRPVVHCHISVGVIPSCSIIFSSCVLTDCSTRGARSHLPVFWPLHGSPEMPASVSLQPLLQRSPLPPEPLPLCEGALSPPARVSSRLLSHSIYLARWPCSRPLGLRS